MTTKEGKFEHTAFVTDYKDDAKSSWMVRARHDYSPYQNNAKGLPGFWL